MTKFGILQQCANLMQMILVSCLCQGYTYKNNKILFVLTECELDYKNAFCILGHNPKTERENDSIRHRETVN
jgi:hypothetical protein